MWYWRVAWGIGCLIVGTGCGRWADKLACGAEGCDFTSDEWGRVRSLAFICSEEQQAEEQGVGMPVSCGVPIAPDFSNRYLPIDETAWGTPDAPGTGTLKPNPAADPFVALGRRLYFEPLLSGTATWKDTLGRTSPSARAPIGKPIGVSCASCHDPSRFGSDFTSVPRTVSIGAGWYDVNGQSTLSAARMPAITLGTDASIHPPLLYWNGRADSLWTQAAQVMESPVSMNGHRMKTFWVIVNHYRDAYGIFPEAPAAGPSADDPTPAAPPTWEELADTLQPPAEATATTDDYKTQYASLSKLQQQTITFVHVNVAKAIAAYEWLLSSDHSAFDRFVAEGPESTALSPSAKRGLKLFVGKASCIDCHSSPIFSDGKPHNIGIPQIGSTVPTVAECSDLQSAPKCDCVSGSSCLPWGVYAGLKKLAAQEFSRSSAYSDDLVARGQPKNTNDPDESFKGAWRTPSLRDVAMTAPYMHDGAFATLADVIWHYDQAGGSSVGGETVGRSDLSPLNLTAGEREDLEAFLSSLTGSPRKALLGAPPDGGTNAPEVGSSVILDAGVDAPGAGAAIGLPDAELDAGIGGDGH